MIYAIFNDKAFQKCFGGSQARLTEFLEQCRNAMKDIAPRGLDKL